MTYVSLYRKWRPQTFEEVIGQEFVTRTLKNSLKNGSNAHAYLFAGPRGTGKTSTARILAKALNCEHGPTPEPCNVCDSCRDITEGRSVDTIEIDAASNRGIDDIRDLRERAVFSPAAARVKVYILDEAHMLTPPAFNALLKMLEEPPSHVVFVLATTEPYKMPPTILSRCQRFEFRSVPAPLLTQHLARICGEEGVEASDDALRLIARRARGSARDALVVLEQVISYAYGEVEEKDVAGFLGLIEDEMLVRLGDSLAGEDMAGTIELVEQAYEEGKDLVQFAREVQEHFRRVFLLQHADLSHEDLEVDEGAYEGIRRQAREISPRRAFHFISALREAVREMQATSSSRMVLEGALIGMARSELDISPEALSARLEKLEGEIERWFRKSGTEAPAAGERPGRKGDKEESAGTPLEKTEEREQAGSDAAEPEGQVPGSETAAEASVAAATVDLAAVRRAWPRVRERVKEKRVTTHAFLLEGKPVEVSGEVLMVSFPPDRSFHRGEMEKEDHRGMLEEALEEVLGVRLRVASRIEAEDVEAGPPRDEGGGGEEGRRVPAGEEAPPRSEKSEPEPPVEEEPCEEGDTEASKRRMDEKDVEIHDAGKVKLVKDVLGAEVIEEITLGEEG